MNQGSELFIKAGKDAGFRSPKKQAKTKGSEQSIETGKESGIRAFHKEQRREEFQGSEQRGNRVSSIKATRNLGYAANTCEF